MTEEIWKPVLGYESSYEVSNLGRVKSVRGILKPCRHPSGHLHVSLCMNGHRTTAKIHRLVLAVFVGPAPNGFEARHLDGDPTNNKLENIQWASRSENMSDRKDHKPPARYKLNSIRVENIKQLLTDGVSPLEIAKNYSVHFSTIYRIRSGEAHNNG